MREHLPIGLPQDPIPVRVFIPAEVAFNIEQFSKVVVNLGRRLGCESCLSGASCHFILERDFVVNPANLELEGMRH
jgi:hypothetical protein